MDLILWRHAEAELQREGLSDLDRALTNKGHKQAKRMAEWLNRVLPESARILVSPAVRTQETAEALGRRFKTVKGLSPEESVEALLCEARWPSAKELTVVVGHQPTLGLTAAYLLGCGNLSADEPWRIKKGSIWWLRGREDEAGKLRTQLVAVRSSEML